MRAFLLALALPALCVVATAGCQNGPFPTARAAPLPNDLSVPQAASPVVVAPRLLASNSRVGLSPLPGYAAIARHVIIVSEDGLRPDALLRAHAVVHQRLMREGAYSLKAETIRQASTLPSHGAMLSGFDVPDHGVSWNSWQPARGFIKVPTVMNAARDAGHGTAAFVGKRKLAHVVRPGVVDVFARPGFYCRKVVEAATEYFLEHRPQIEFVHFSDPDSLGHSSGWMSEAQMVAIRQSDDCLGTLVEAVANSDLASSTLIIVSSDHGGHGHNHSGRKREDRLIPWFAWGAGVRPGHEISRLVSTMDTAATTLWVLGHAMPENLTGRPVEEAFRDVL